MAGDRAEKLKEQLQEGLQSVLDLVRSTKEAYEGANRFARMRIAVLAVFGADVLLTLILVLALGGKSIDLEVWFERGFPSNMLVLRNQTGDPLEQVTLILDGKYRLSVPRIPPGLRGFEVNRDFRDGEYLAPSDKYRPTTLLIRTEDDEFSMPVPARGR